MGNDTAICFLVINQIKELPHVAISSALQKTTSDIYVGYLDPKALTEIPSDPRIKLIQLSKTLKPALGASAGYQDFGTEKFYELVILKWELLREVSSAGYPVIIYSDIDVIWLGDAAQAIKKTFELFAKAHILVQSFTRNPNDALLCMGIFAFRNSPTAASFINQCESEHEKAIKRLDRIGDDEIVTSVNRKLNFPEYLRELPQSTFAVGNFLDLYSNKSRFPGIHKPVPLVFHCNYVVGLRNKRLMIRLVLNRRQRKELKVKFGFSFFILLILKRIKTSFIFRQIKGVFT